MVQLLSGRNTIDQAPSPAPPARGAPWTVFMPVACTRWRSRPAHGWPLCGKLRRCRRRGKRPARPLCVQGALRAASGYLRATSFSPFFSQTGLGVELSGTLQDCGGRGLELVRSILTNAALASTPEELFRALFTC